MKNTNYQNQKNIIPSLTLLLNILKFIDIFNILIMIYLTYYNNKSQMNIYSSHGDNILKKLTSNLSTGRFPLLLRGSRLLIGGAIIAVLENGVAILLGLHKMPLMQAIIVSIMVIGGSLLLSLIPHLIKNLKVWHELFMFIIYYVLYQFAFCFWIYRLGEMRLLALINALIIITMLLLYTNPFQSFLISISTLISYFTMSWYSISVAGQAGSVTREMFFSLCLIPSFIFTSSGAHFLNCRRKEVKKAKLQLEKLNRKLEREKQLSEVELDLAKDIQKSIFHNIPPKTSNWEISFFSKPYRSVSGDFFDFYKKDDSLEGLCLFDVSGHGVAPALITILAKPVVKNFFNFHKHSSLGKIAQSINNSLKDQLEEVNLFITGILLRFENSHVEYVNAGHPDLIHFDNKSKNIQIINKPEQQTKGVPFGITNGNDKYKSLKFKINKGDFFIIYSDGLTDERDDNGNIYGKDRLLSRIESFTGSSSQNLLDHIVSDFNAFRGSGKIHDDISLIIGKRN